MFSLLENDTNSEYRMLEGSIVSMKRHVDIRKVDEEQSKQMLSLDNKEANDHL